MKAAVTGEFFGDLSYPTEKLQLMLRAELHNGYGENDEMVKLIRAELQKRDANNKAGYET
jgi:hypothetical protein